MRNTLRALSAILFLTAASEVSSEQTRTDSVAVPAIAAQAADVATIDGVMKAFYEVISGPAGQPRQWSRDRTLYMPEIRFVSMDVDSKGKPVPRIVTHQQFVDASNPSMVAKGFDEREIRRVTKRFGNIAHVFSTYETRQTPGGPLTGRGINSIELFWDGDRWWIASAIWDDERPDNPIPKEYLP